MSFTPPRQHRSAWWKTGAYIVLLVLLTGIGRFAGGTTVLAQAPTITSFTARTTLLNPGESTTLDWILAGATGVRLDPYVGPVTGTGQVVNPSVTTVYTLTVTNATGTNTATVTVNVNPLAYQDAYQSALLGSWIREAFESTPNDIVTDFAAAAPGRQGNAIEARWTQGYESFGLADRKPGYDVQWKYLNECRTVEFDLYFEPDSTGQDTLEFVLEDFSRTDGLRIVDLIPGWAGMTDAQRFGHWFHVAVDIPQIHPTVARFGRFLLSNNTPAGRPHFRLMAVKLGFVNDTTPPVIRPPIPSVNPTYDQLTLAFTTDEATIYRLEYGATNYATVIQGNPDEWAANHTVTITGLQPGATVQYRIVAMDHRADTNASPNVGVYTNYFVMPTVPVTPPVIAGLVASNVLGYRVTLVWTTDRPCTARLDYHKAGGASLTRAFTDLSPSRAALLDLLEPATAYSVALVATDAFGLAATQTLTFATSAASTPTVTVSFSPANTRPISPWIYGLNLVAGDVPNAPTNANIPFHRLGGNRWTAYNWENNASNAGIDYGPFSSDGYLGGDEVPAEAVRSRIASDRTNGMASMMTVQLQGWVAADKSGFVNTNQPGYLTNSFRQVVPRKGSAFRDPPATNDAFVYMDEFVSVLKSRFTNDIFADPLTPTFVSLDNEPELWPSTHSEIQRGPTDPTDYIQRSITLAKTVKDVAPAAQVFGPVNYGFYGLHSLSGAPGFTPEYFFFDRYLDDLRAASDADGRRLLDVYDFHWYSESVVNGNPVTTLRGANLTDEQVEAIVQSPRSLWDPTYREASYIADYYNGPVMLLKRLQDKIDARWPGTRMSISEYENGGGNHIAGAIAQADNLGLFGSYGIYLAAFWPTGFGETYPFVYAAFDMYRNYDGRRGSFGDVSIPAVSSDPAKVSVYLSRDSNRPGRLVMVAINRSTNAQDVAFSGLAVSGTARLYRLQGTTARPAWVGELPVNLASWVVALPPLSVSTIEILRQESYADWKAAVFTAAEQQDAAVSGPDADPDHANLPNLLRYAFSLPTRGPVNPQIAPQIITNGGQNYFGIQYNRKPVASDLLYHLERSVNLTNWLPLATNAPGEPTRLTTQDPLPITSAPARFYRVRVQYTP
ncbi:MAG: hypothetical protein EBS05_04090 [Proteobacteria bacterium]|nr:hypothetical protein [Pseudomonadota bacterium]